jgi:hypothetical protein
MRKDFDPKKFFCSKTGKKHFRLAIVYFFEIEEIPIFPGHALNFELTMSGRTFKIDCLPWKYRYSFNPEKASAIVSIRKTNLSVEPFGLP